MTDPYFLDDSVTVYHGDCIDVLAELDDGSVDAVVTDPPYGIAFMGQAWDQPGQFGSMRRNGNPGVHRRGPDRDITQIRKGAMEATRAVGEVAGGGRVRPQKRQVGADHLNGCERIAKIGQKMLPTLQLCWPPQLVAFAPVMHWQLPPSKVNCQRRPHSNPRGPQTHSNAPKFVGEQPNNRRRQGEEISCPPTTPRQILERRCEHGERGKQCGRVARGVG